MNIFVYAKSSIFDAIQCLNGSGKGIALVVDEHDHLIGTITDADIRQGLAQKFKLEDNVLMIANQNPTFLEDGVSVSSIVRKFRETRLRAIPLLDANKKVVDCVHVEQFNLHQDIEKILLIMAGGFGTRMGDLTADLPKPLLPVNGKPMMQYIVERAANEGFKKIYISTHYLADQIHKCFGQGEAFGVDIEYIFENLPLGTGGSFALLPIDTGPVVVTNADVLSTVGYSKILDFHRLQKADVTIAVRSHSIQHPYGVVESDGIEFRNFVEKPSWCTNVNAGIYVLDAKLKSGLVAQKPITMPEIIQEIKNQGGKVIIFPLHENWVDLGNMGEYTSFQNL